MCVCVGASPNQPDVIKANMNPRRASSRDRLQRKHAKARHFSSTPRSVNMFPSSFYTSDVNVLICHSIMLSASNVLRVFPVTGDLCAALHVGGGCGSRRVSVFPLLTVTYIIVRDTNPCPYDTQHGSIGKIPS